MSETSTLISYTAKITRRQLAAVATPPATATHNPIPHHQVVETLIETLNLRQIAVVAEEFAMSRDGMELFAVLDLEAGFEQCRFAIGIRNANNKRFRLACTVGLRVFVCANLVFQGDYAPVLAKHSKNFSLQDSLSIGVDRMQRNFEPMRRLVEAWREKQLSDDAAKLIIYRAFVEADLDVPKHLARRVHQLYFEPQHAEFQPRTLWSLSNALLRPSKSSTQFPNLRRLQSWRAFWTAPGHRFHIGPGLSPGGRLTANSREVVADQTHRDTRSRVTSWNLAASRIGLVDSVVLTFYDKSSRSISRETAAQDLCWPIER